MRRRIMSFGSFAADFDGTDEQAQDVYSDYMQDAQSGGADLEALFGAEESSSPPPRSQGGDRAP